MRPRFFMQSAIALQNGEGDIAFAVDSGQAHLAFFGVETNVFFLFERRFQRDVRPIGVGGEKILKRARPAFRGVPCPAESEGRTRGMDGEFPSPASICRCRNCRG